VNAEHPPAPTQFTEAQLNAMLTLLADEDPHVHEAIRAKLLAAGEPALRFLERQRLHPEPAIRRRVRELLDQRAGERLDGEFLSFVLGQGEQFDLEDGVWRFTLTRYPDINVAAFRAQLDDWADRARRSLTKDATGEETLLALNHVLFVELGFRGNNDDYYDPANSYVNLVMDRRRGIPISLSAVYLFVARRLGLPVAGIGMPGHFLCRYQTPREEFYVDAFNGGKLLTRIDCKRRIANLAVEYDESQLAPVTSRRILQRMIANLHLVHKERKHRAEAERLQRYLVALSR
jgi:regulator of sirC expression with transglutaminase-like and TPR domain